MDLVFFVRLNSYVLSCSVTGDLGGLGPMRGSHLLVLLHFFESKLWHDSHFVLAERGSSYY